MKNKNNNLELFDNCYFKNGKYARCKYVMVVFGLKISVGL